MKPESFDEQLSRFDLMCEGDPTFDLSDNDIAALLAVRTEMRIMARSTLASQERIKELEAKLAALDWSPITESNLPSIGDLVGNLSGDFCQIGDPRMCEFGYLTEADWTHLLRVNLPDPRNFPSEVQP